MEKPAINEDAPTDNANVLMIGSWANRSKKAKNTIAYNIKRDGVFIRHFLFLGILSLV
jgi:hypothetical protein